MASVAVTSPLPACTATSSPALIPATRALMSKSTDRPSWTVATWRPSTRTATDGSWATLTWCRIRSTSSVLPGAARVAGPRRSGRGGSATRPAAGRPGRRPAARRPRRPPRARRPGGWPPAAAPRPGPADSCPASASAVFAAGPKSRFAAVPGPAWTVVCHGCLSSIVVTGAPACGSMRTVSAGRPPVSRTVTDVGGPACGTARTSPSGSGRCAAAPPRAERRQPGRGRGQDQPGHGQQDRQPVASGRAVPAG